MKLRIKEIRKENNVSQKQLAEFLNIGQQAISNWEVGKTEPDIATLARLAKYFNVTLDYLTGKTLVKFASNDVNKELVQLVSQLDDNEKEILMKLIEYMLTRRL